MIDEDITMTELMPHPHLREIERNGIQIEQLNIHMAVMIRQHESLQKTLDKIFKKLEQLEERQNSLEKEQLRELANKEGKKSIIDYASKYWWVVIIVILLFNDQEFLQLVKKFF